MFLINTVKKLVADIKPIYQSAIAINITSFKYDIFHLIPDPCLIAWNKLFDA